MENKTWKKLSQTKRNEINVGLFFYRTTMNALFVLSAIAASFIAGVYCGDYSTHGYSEHGGSIHGGGGYQGGHGYGPIGGGGPHLGGPGGGSLGAGITLKDNLPLNIQAYKVKK